MNILARALFTLLIGLAIGPRARASATPPNPCANLVEGPSVLIDPITYQFKEMLPFGFVRFKKERDVYRERNAIFSANFFGMETLHLSLDWAFLGEGRVLLTGGGGGAKTAVVRWHALAEVDKPFELLMTPMTPVSALVGGEVRAAAENGIYQINTSGSAADSKVVLLDEAHLAGSHTLVALFPLLERPSQHRHGSVSGPTKIETVFATANANLAEIVDYFWMDGRGPSAAPYLNRWQIKAHVPNRLDNDDVAQPFLQLQDRVLEKARLTALAKNNPELASKIAKDKVFLTPGSIDWEFLRTLTPLIFEFSDEAKTGFKDFAKKYDDATRLAIKNSENSHRDNPSAEPTVYAPTGDLTTRLMTQFLPMIRETALLDLLSSPLADDGNLEKLLQKPIVLGPLSLWRAFYFLTMVGPGRSRLVYTPDREDRKIQVDFGWKLQVSDGRDHREELMLKRYFEEQERFNTCFWDVIKDLQGVMEFIAKHRPGERTEAFSHEDFELQLIHARGEFPGMHR